MPDSLTITREWFAMLESLPTVQSRWNVLCAVSRFAFDGVKPDDLNAMEKAVFMNMKNAILNRRRRLRNYRKNKENCYNVTLHCNGDGCELNHYNVTLQCNGVEEQELPLNIKESQENSLKDITMDLLKEDRKKINQKKNEENKPTARRVFKVPTLEEVRDYIFDKGYSVDPEEFFSFYESQGWHVGKNKMRDWHRAVSYWQCRINNRTKTRAQLRDYSGI